MAVRRETDLYQPIKTFLEGQGYEVKGEVGDCDLLAVRGKEEPVVVEMKRRFSLELVLQGVDRLKVSDKVYLAVPEPERRNGAWRGRSRNMTRLCRMLGLGLLIVGAPRKNGASVEPRLDPAPYQPRKSKRRRDRLLKEFASRVGDPNHGGATRRPIVTAYRQDALRCAELLERAGPLSLADLREQTGVQRAGGIMRRDVYGWFERVERGVYALSPKGRRELAAYADVIAMLRAA